MLTAADPTAPSGAGPRRRTSAALIIVAAFLVGLPVSRDMPSLWLGTAGVLLAVTAVAVIVAEPAVWRVVLLVDLVVVFAGAGAWLLPAGLLTWPATVLLAMVAGLGAVRLFPALRPAAPWLRRGRMRPEVPWVVLAVVVLSAGALIAWARLADPEAPPFVANLGDRPAVVVAAAIAGFSVVNAIAEEFLYRGVLQTELTAHLGATTAVVVQAAAFGVAHWSGFPSGWLGMLMSASYGLILGIVRHRTGGILVVFLAHIVADTTIGLLGVVLLK